MVKVSNVGPLTEEEHTARGTQGRGEFLAFMALPSLAHEKEPSIGPFLYNPCEGPDEEGLVFLGGKPADVAHDELAAGEAERRADRSPAGGIEPEKP